MKLNSVISETDQYHENELFMRALKSSIYDKTLTSFRKSYEQQCDLIEIENTTDNFLNDIIDSVKIEIKYSTH